MKDYTFNSSVSNMILNLSWDMTLEHKCNTSQLSLFYKFFHGIEVIPRPVDHIYFNIFDLLHFTSEHGSHCYKLHTIF